MFSRVLTGIVIVAFAVAAPERAAGQDRNVLFSPNHPDVLRIKAERDKAEQRLDEAKQRLERAQREGRSIREELRQKTGRMDISNESLAKAAARLESELERLQLDTAGGEARIEALQKTVATVSDRAESAAAKDEVAAELAVVVGVRQKEVVAQQMLIDAKGGSQLDLERAKAAVAEAKARLAERRQAVVAATGGGGLSDWNRELLNLSLDAQERRARTRFLEEGLTRLGAAMPLLERLEMSQETHRAALREVDEARSTLKDAEREWERIVPLITPATQPAPKGTAPAPGAP